MKKIIPLIIIVVPVFLLAFCTGSYSVDTKKNSMAPPGKIIVLELFTSQGCSSCPPADRLLGAYAGREDIAALSFHVDYWNRLGWKDPFSDPAFSERQENYSASFASAGVYTPQLIINGEKEMVGSDENKITATLKEFQSGAASQIIIDEIKTENDKLSLVFSLLGKQDHSVVNIALVQNSITTSVKAGENKGLSITNYNVVRNFKTIASYHSENNKTTIDLIPGINKKECSVILYVQDSKSNKIYAAAKSGL